MEKKQLISLLNEILIPIGFKKKGNYWISSNETITKIINLQKSSYSNSFYINYGYIVNRIPLGNLLMHVYNRLTSVDAEKRSKIAFLFNLESDICDNEREIAIKKVLENKLIKKIQNVNTEDDLLEELKKRPYLNDIPLAIKQHFNLDSD